MQTLQELPPPIKQLSAEATQIANQVDAMIVAARHENTALAAQSENIIRHQKVREEYIVKLEHAISKHGVPIDDALGETKTEMRSALLAAMMADCTEVVTRNAYLRSRGWRMAANAATWIDPIGGGASVIQIALKLQIKRDLKPFFYLLKELNPQAKLPT